MEKFTPMPESYKNGPLSNLLVQPQEAALQRLKYLCDTKLVARSFTVDGISVPQIFATASKTTFPELIGARFDDFKPAGIPYPLPQFDPQIRLIANLIHSCHLLNPNLVQIPQAVRVIIDQADAITARGGNNVHEFLGGCFVRVELLFLNQDPRFQQMGRLYSSIYKQLAPPDGLAVFVLGMRKQAYEISKKWGQIPRNTTFEDYCDKLDQQQENARRDAQSRLN